MKIFLKTPRLILRQWTDADLGPFTSINSDAETMRYFPALLERKETERNINKYREAIEKNGFGFFAVDHRASRSFLGVIGVSDVDFVEAFTPAMEVGWRIDKRFWNQGLATEGARGCLEFAFSNLGRKEIVALTTPENRPSRRVMEKLGMKHDPKENFFHPKIHRDHRLAEHVLYRIKESEFNF